ncbi:precorrin-8X methylmutase [Alkaliphilus pronyensis]|uniref:Precorrin-8X methylmutase n=1 Tax=Alkaliphilus pronyensis TaxID=1482732 RepID=A0A6I0F7Y1_9FIRM|nr:precorrin-8X methylmutase [Alkaliphilus pronyensis]KAB3539051.1 precorrin-8X methylmutase [Alkaliphilus pronyensis]
MEYQYIKNPTTIENRSFEIITEELGEKNNRFDEKTGKVVKRVIHTTADFQYADLMEFHPKAIEMGITALKEGCNIYADTQMVYSGINKKRLSGLGGYVCNFVHDPEVAKEAKVRGITRSMISIEKAMADESIRIYAIGNAPTALFNLIEMINEGMQKPNLVIGVPVGFVGAVESKEALTKLEVPYIVTRGRKGGSGVAAAIVNALLYMI